ncbi:MAG: phosphoribosylformylglycinamidine synthase subunit PurQ [Polyangiaceae bacterium]
MSSIRVVVLSGFGFNCEHESKAAWGLAGATAEIRHVSELFEGTLDIATYDVVHFPGGFSYGDELGSGKVLANHIRSKKLPNGTRVLDVFARFLEGKGLLVGICNGFQVLVKSGLLPNLSGKFEKEVTLTVNLSARFEDRWVRCVPAGVGKRMLGTESYELPARHGEGRIAAKDDATLAMLHEKGLVALQYVDAEGKPTEHFPENPNGSPMGIASLVSADGQVIGMMPHPEAHLSRLNHPAWALRARDGMQVDGESDGLRLFRNLVTTAKNLKGSAT